MAAIDVERLRAFSIPEVQDMCDPRAAILYALGIGAGLAPFDETHLVFERNLAVLPAMVLVLGTPGFWPMAPELGWNWPLIRHGDQSFKLFRPLELGQLVHGRIEICHVADEGPGKAALVQARRTLRTPTDRLIAVLDETWVLKGAGGLGGVGDMATSESVSVPDDAPDASIDLPTTVNQAMLYRLTGDRNPLHIDQGTATAAGLERPPLHSAATMGLVSRALTHLCCDGQPALLTEMNACFQVPAWPGETIRTEIWRRKSELLYRASVPARDAVVMTGCARVGSDAEQEEQQW